MMETAGGGAVCSVQTRLPEQAQEPVLEENAGLKSEQDGVYRWTFSDPQPEPSYHAAFYGLEADGKRVLLQEGDFQEDTVSLAAGDWAYTRVLLELIKPGTADENGFTKTMQCSVQKEYDLASKLPAPENVRAVFSGSEDFTCRLSWEAGTEEAKNSSAGYTIYLNGAEYTQVSNGGCETLLDLSAYEGQTVQLAVQARVRSSAWYNLDGPLSPALEVQVPVRLQTPDPDSLTVRPAYDPLWGRFRLRNHPDGVDRADL